MNLLVTNTRAAQAYFIIRALEADANKIIATIYGNNRPLAWLSCPAAHSRLVDKYYFVPSFAGDWKRGRLSDKNTDKEKAYIEEVLRICKLERIDTIFPSWDAHIYIFSKNKQRFAEAGVFIPIPDYDAYSRLLDKYQIIKLAKDAGLSCPKTFLPSSLQDLDWVSREIGFPAAVKPRFASWGVQIAQNPSELQQITRRGLEQHGMPMIQEVIPGTLRQDAHFILDQNGDVLVRYQRNIRRTLRFDSYAHFSPISEIEDSLILPGQTDVLLKSLKNLGWWGSGILETIIDPRDGKTKVSEFIPRFRRQLWNSTEIGLNEPRICLSIARGESVESIKPCTRGTLFLSPIEDALVLIFQILDLLAFKLRKLTGQIVVDPTEMPLSFKEIIRSFKNTYLSRRHKVIDPFSRYLFSDPLVCLLWWLQLTHWISGLSRQLGR